MEIIKHSVKVPSKIETIMGMITGILNLFIMFRLMDSLSGFGGILIYAGLVGGAFLCFVVLRLALYNTFKKVTDLQLKCVSLYV